MGRGCPCPACYRRAAAAVHRMRAPYGAAATRRLGSRRLGHRARFLADLQRRGRARADRGLHARGVRRRHHVLRHGQRLRPGRGRERVGRDPRGLRARLVRAGDEGLLPDVGARPRALARADPQADRRLARAPARRVRRPLPVPPLRRRRAAGGDDGGADRGGARRQGALHRLQRMAAGPDPGGARPPRRRGCPPGHTPRRIALRAIRQVRLQPAAVLGAVAGAGGRGDPALRAQRHLAGRVVAARPGRADRQVPARRGAAAGLARAARAR